MPDVLYQTPECQDTAFLQSAYFSVLSCSGACIQLCYSVETGLQCVLEWRLINTTLFALFYFTINGMVLAVKLVLIVRCDSSVQLPIQQCLLNVY